MLSEKHLNQAIREWKEADKLAKKPGNEKRVSELRESALTNLGRGEHALQDIDAHGDMRFHISQKYDYKETNQEGYINTEKASKEYIKRFIDATGYKADKK